jgi:hypothetical protein
VVLEVGFVTLGMAVQVLVEVEGLLTSRYMLKKLG